MENQEVLGNAQNSAPESSSKSDEEGKDAELIKKKP